MEKIVNIVHFIKSNRMSYPEFFVIIGVILNSFLWSVIALLRYYSMYDLVFDSGIVTLTMEYNLHFFNAPFLMYMTGFSLDRILFSPLILIDGIPGMLVIQEIALSIPAYVIFKIGQLKIKDNFTLMLISFAYLIYFPLSGAFFYDYHFQTFFILFFLLGVYLFETKRYKSSTLLMFLAGSVRFPYMIFPVLFFLIILIQSIMNRADPEQKLKKIAIMNVTLMGATLALSYFLISDSYFLLAQKVFSDSGFSGYLHINSNSFMGNFLSNLNNKIVTVLLIFSPFLFISIKKFKWIIYTIPYLFLLIFNTYSAYVYPDFNHLQYASLYAPFLFLLILENIPEGIQTKVRNEDEKNRLMIYYNQVKTEIRKRRKPITFFLIVLVTAIIFQPYSPVNNYSSNSFNMNIFHPNIATYNDYVKVVNLIPANDPYVLYQNNLPYVDVHDPALSCLDAYRQFFQPSNYSHIILMNGSTTSRIDYVLAYVNDFPLHLDTINLIDKLYQNGNYGIEAYLGGFILLAKNYTKEPVYLSQVSFKNDYISSYNTSQFIFTFPTLVPGVYNFNFTSVNSDSMIIFDKFYSNYISNVTYSVLNETKYSTGNSYNLNVTINIESVILDGYAIFNTKHSEYNSLSIYGPFNKIS